MSTQKVIVSGYEASQVPEATTTPGSSPQPTPRLSPAIPWWARIGLSLVALCFPLLCLITLVLRIAFRAETPRIKYAWTSFLNTLLMVSGLLTLVAGSFVFFLAPVPVITGSGLTDLDERDSFPALPSATSLTSVDASRLLKPLVIVVSPAATRLWTNAEVPSNSFGAGELLHADKDGYLFVTARHVAQLPQSGFGLKPSHVLISTQEGTWGTADIIATADSLDLALLWLPRHTGSLTFTQPLTTISDGAAVFVIGHPEGLRYTLSTGIVSGFHDQSIQISAAISPGNSGGPVYDDHGNLAGIVSSKFDHNQDANAENLSFAVKPAALLTPDVWHFSKGGRVHLQHYVDALKSSSK
ncbi:S1C family serine protease [Granulicella arctica]|uniref:S1-C subfamily serine protease n=1 Tax=Granulicella arctica TaxID=940613 RepID=A0A7Y9PF88_9BACT|nr:serine protease [Granulicella arctica]NYF78066.1 S1-C subfamily serine protease [Granulicella arctica]